MWILPADREAYRFPISSLESTSMKRINQVETLKSIYGVDLRW